MNIHPVGVEVGGPSAGLEVVCHFNALIFSLTSSTGPKYEASGTYITMYTVRDISTIFTTVLILSLLLIHPAYAM